MAGSENDPLLAPMKGVDTRVVGGVQVDVARAGDGRIKRVIYQPGFRWSTHMKDTVSTNPPRAMAPKIRNISPLGPQARNPIGAIPMISARHGMRLKTFVVNLNPGR